MRAYLKSWIIALVLFFNVVLAGYYLSLKTGFHVDEQLSYGHANSTQGAFLSPHIDSFLEDTHNEIHHKWLSGKVFQNYLMVQEGEQFRYGHIWENLAKDVHPPFYYVLLHTVCSFFPDVFDKWQAGALNLVALLLTLWVLFKLSKLFFEDDFVALLPVVLYGFSNAAMGTALFLRMYMFQTLFAVCLIYETMKMLIENKADAKRLGLIFAYSTLGILTQYVSLVFSFIVAAVGCLVLLCRKQYALLIKYAVVMLLSALVLFWVFPPALEVLLYSEKGVRTADLFAIFLDNPFYVWAVQGERLTDVYLKELLSLHKNYAVWLLLLIILGAVVFLCTEKRACQNRNIWVLVFVCLLMAMYISFFMPRMGEFDLRYFALLMPLLAVLTVYFVYAVSCCLGLRKSFILTGLWVLVLANSVMADFSARSAFRFQTKEIDDKFAADVKGKKVFVTEGWAFAFFEHVLSLKEAEAVWASSKLCSPQLVEEMKKTPQALAVLHHSHIGRYCMSCWPEKPAGVCLAMAPFLRFMYTIRQGETFYDVYEVKPAIGG